MKSFHNPLAWLFSSSSNSTSKQHKRRQSTSSISHMFASPQLPPQLSSSSSSSSRLPTLIGGKKNDKFSFNFNTNSFNQHAINQQHYYPTTKQTTNGNSSTTLNRTPRTPTATSGKTNTSTLGPASYQRSCPGSLKRIKSLAPLSAQEATYEAMRTIDMYLIRQIARSCMVSFSSFSFSFLLFFFFDSFTYFQSAATCCCVWFRR